MNNNQGFIKIFRKIIDWEWFRKPNTRLVFEYFLYKANYEDKMWKGIEIKRGQLITSLQNIANDNGITIRQTRTAINDLQSTNNITVKTTNKYSIITVVNYDLYQTKEEKSTYRTTNKLSQTRQTNDMQDDNNIRIKEIKNKRSVCVENTQSLTPTLSDIIAYGNSLGANSDYCERFYNHYESIGWVNANGIKIKNWKLTLNNWYKKDLESGKIKIDNRRRLG